MLVLVTFESIAQASIEDLNNALGFESTVDDVPESPINFLIGAFFVVATYLGIKKLNINLN